MTAPRCTSERDVFTTASLINRIVEVVHPPGLAWAKPRRDRFRLLKNKTSHELKDCGEGG